MQPVRRSSARWFRDDHVEIHTPPRGKNNPDNTFSQTRNSRFCLILGADFTNKGSESKLDGPDSLAYESDLSGTTVRLLITRESSDAAAFLSVSPSPGVDVSPQPCGREDIPVCDTTPYCSGNRSAWPSDVPMPTATFMSFLPWMAAEARWPRLPDRV